MADYWSQIFASDTGDCLTLTPSLSPANIAINDIPLKLDSSGYVAESVGVFSTTFTSWAPKATDFGEITQSNGHYVVKGHSRSPILVPIESRYVTSVINTNLPLILHRFQVIGQIFASDKESLHFNALAGGYPLRISG